jgi:hypothetical protein
MNLRTPKAQPGQLYTLLGPDRKPYPSRPPGRYGGYRPRKLYGRLDCLSALRAVARGGYVKDRVFRRRGHRHRRRIPALRGVPTRPARGMEGHQEGLMSVTQHSTSGLSGARQKAVEQAATKRPRTKEPASPCQ